MRIALALVVSLLLAGCGTAGSGHVADPGGDGRPMPTQIPAASGPVSTRDLATVMDSGEKPELCLGAVAESYPPQCRGVALSGWDWADHDGAFERFGDIRWGAFHVTGTFDGTTMTVREAVPAASYDAEPAPNPTLCEDVAGADCSGPTQARLLQIQQEVQDLPGVLTVWTSSYAVVVDVVHDDGSLQDWADATYGDGVVVITSALVPPERPESN